MAEKNRTKAEVGKTAKKTFKKTGEERKLHAKVLYMAGEPLNVIAERVGVSRPTLNRWISEGGWKETRAARNITRPELVNKTLQAIDSLLDSINASKDPQKLISSSDQLSKLASMVEKLDKKANIVDAIDVFIAFDKWLQEKSMDDDGLTGDFIRKVNRYQDLFVASSTNRKMEAQ